MDYFKDIDFEQYKKGLDLKAATDGEWVKQRNGVFVRSLISQEESNEKNVTYIGLKFPKPTDGHSYHTQTDTIRFKGKGFIEFSYDGGEREPYTFVEGDSIQIPSNVVRKIIPFIRDLEMELIVTPRFDPKDEIHVYD
jgi:hypothetical protein